MISRSRFAREGISRLLDRNDQLSVCSHHGSLDRALPAIIDKNPDVVVIDVSDPRDSQAITAIRAIREDVAIVVSGIPLTEEAVITCAKAGATGYIRCDASGSDWVFALQAALAGHVSDPAVAGLLNQHIAASASAQSYEKYSKQTDSSWRIAPDVEASATKVGLTPRERQVLGLVDKGLSTKQIARKLGCSPATVKAHVQAVLTKYNVHRRSEAAAIFRKTEQTSSTMGDSADRQKHYAPN